MSTMTKKVFFDSSTVNPLWASDEKQAYLDEAFADGCTDNNNKSGIQSGPNTWYRLWRDQQAAQDWVDFVRDLAAKNNVDVLAAVITDC